MKKLFIHISKIIKLHLIFIALVSIVISPIISYANFFEDEHFQVNLEKDHGEEDYNETESIEKKDVPKILSSMNINSIVFTTLKYCKIPPSLSCFIMEIPIPPPDVAQIQS